MIDFKPVREYLKYGVITNLAEKNGLNKHRAWSLLKGKVKPKESDLQFIDDCIEEATKTKALFEPRISRIKPL